ncbi:hypothetical protein EU802_07950 [Corynebacterium silvaticum]|nr:hypothetical protein EU802_07950 [Corynebacterium silvaticum]TNX79134.1 hypothetical protein FIT55_09500 [Corynebacterium silvaticum]TRM16787.1 hypothetical protein ET810_007980 [Corynebacterium silvaticum]
MITLEHLSQTTVTIETFVTNGIEFPYMCDVIAMALNDAPPHLPHSHLARGMPRYSPGHTHNHSYLLRCRPSPQSPRMDKVFINL